MPELAEFAAGHFKAVVEKRVRDVIDNYAPSETTYVALEGPRWTTIGHEQIAAGWKAFVDSKITLKSCEWTEGPFEHVAGSMGWIAGIVRMELEISGKPKTVGLRGTFVVSRADGDKWRIVHEHFSQPHPDPYGIGDWK